MAHTEQAVSTIDAEESSVPAYAWVILLVVYIASVAAPLCMAKVPPLMPILMAFFSIDIGQAGALMSVFAITGLILALPTGLILARLGLRITGMIALACLICGAALGALASSISLMLFSRVIEGIGMGLITVTAPAAIAMWFPPAQRGGAMGIWATWVPMGNVLMYSLAPALATRQGWQSVWWFSAGFALFALLLYSWLMRTPDEADSPAAGLRSDPSLGKALSNRFVWLLALSFGAFNLVFLGFGTFFPTFLVEVRGYPLSQAAFIASISTVLALISAPAAGWLSDRLGTRRWLILIPTVIIALLMLLPFRLTGTGLYVAIVLLGLFMGAIPTATFSAVPEVMEQPQQAGQGLAILALGQNLGMVIGPLFFGALIVDAGWINASYWMIPFFGVVLIAAALVKVR